MSLRISILLTTVIILFAPSVFATKASGPLSIEINAKPLKNNAVEISVSFVAAIDLSNVNVELSASPGAKKIEGEPMWQGGLVAKKIQKLVVRYQLPSPPSQSPWIATIRGQSENISFGKQASLIFPASSTVTGVVQQSNRRAPIKAGAEEYRAP
ncbi:MAG: hypothetical protein OEX11_07290 [Nitrosomonas sp.]|nr:hypothetical protein [Nitrosomonas sp.]